MLNHPKRPTLLAICLVLSAGSVASAQQGSMFGASSPLTGINGMSNGSTGIPGVGGTLGATSSAFSGGMTSGGMGNGLTANSLGSQFGTGMTTSPTQGGARSTLLGANNAQNGLLGATQQGAGSQGNRNQQGQQGFNNQRNNQGNRNQGNRGANRGNNNQQQQQFTNQGNGQRGNSQQKSIRPQLRVAFQSPRLKAETTLKNINGRLGGLSKRDGFGGINVDVDGGKVTLRGQVDSEDSRKLAAMLVGLEPGVRSVQNELTVKNPPPPEPGE